MEAQGQVLDVGDEEKCSIFNNFADFELGATGRPGGIYFLLMNPFVDYGSCHNRPLPKYVLHKRDCFARMCCMAANRNKVNQVEGKWDELIRHPDQFAGQRVRVTVLSGEETGAASLLVEIRRWLAEGEALEIAPPASAKPNVFGDALVEKFRKQGLVL